MEIHIHRHNTEYLGSHNCVCIWPKDGSEEPTSTRFISDFFQWNLHTVYYALMLYICETWDNYVFQSCALMLLYCAQKLSVQICSIHQLKANNCHDSIAFIINLKDNMRYSLITDPMPLHAL